MCWRYVLEARCRRAQPLGHGLPALNQTMASRRSPTGSAVGAGQLHPATVVVTGLLDHPVGAQCMQTGNNTDTAGRMATCDSLTCQNEIVVHHMRRGLRNGQRFTVGNGRMCRSQGSSHRHRASRRYVGRRPHRSDSCCAQFFDGYTARHGRSGARATMQPKPRCACCLTRPSQCRSRSRWTMSMQRKPVG